MILPLARAAPIELQVRQAVTTSFELEVHPTELSRYYAATNRIEHIGKTFAMTRVSCLDVFVATTSAQAGVVFAFNCGTAFVTS